MSEIRFSLRIAGNTTIPAVHTLKTKGYTIIHYYVQNAAGELHGQWEAEKNGYWFSATSPEEVLGLIALWEVRGNEWQTRPGEREFYDQLVELAPIYDLDGRLLQEE